MDRDADTVRAVPRADAEPGSADAVGRSDPVELAWGSTTDVGRVRTVNEDAVLAVPPIFLVADGMGGYAAGDVASSAVVAAFSEARSRESVTPDWVLDCLATVDAELRDTIEGGTTVTGAAIVRQEGRPYWMVFNAGDSRVYHATGGAVEQVTVDHSVVQELVDAGELTAEQARLHPRRNVITRAVGSPEEIRPDIWLLPMQPGGRLMLCSDGVTSELSGDAIRAIVADGRGPQDTADALVAAALSAGGRDNVSAVVVDVIAVGVGGAAPVEEGETLPHERRSAACDDDPGRTRPRADAVSPSAGSVS